MYFGSKAEVHNLRIGSSMPQTLWTGVSSFGCGMFATCFNAPFDVAKSRMQQQVTGTGARYHNTIQTLGLVYKEEGIWALYKGFWPKALRMASGFAVAQIVFDTAQFLQGA